MWALLLVLIALLFVVNKSREHFIGGISTLFGLMGKGLVIGTGDWGYTTNTKTDKGIEIFSTFPNTCKPNEDLDFGMFCYPKCHSKYYGVGPVCWVETKNVGVGRPVGLEPCPDGWVNDGLTCREPIKCASGWDFFRKGCSGGRLRGRLNSGGICDWPEDRTKLPDWLVDKSDADPKKWKATHPDYWAGLCYRKCPKEYPKRSKIAPYLCFEGGHGVAYGRGVGRMAPPLRIGRIWNPI